MERFIIEVHTPEDSEWVQKKAFKAGYCWINSKQTAPKHLEDNILKFHPDKMGFDSHGKSMNLGFHKDCEVYSFPSQASEIEALFKPKDRRLR
jgi:hypothetical protein